MRWTFSGEATVWGWAPRPALPARAGVLKDPRENLKMHRILRCTLSCRGGCADAAARSAEEVQQGEVARPLWRRRHQGRPLHKVRVDGADMRSVQRPAAPGREHGDRRRGGCCDRVDLRRWRGSREVHDIAAARGAQTSGARWCGATACVEHRTGDLADQQISLGAQRLREHQQSEEQRARPHAASYAFAGCRTTPVLSVRVRARANQDFEAACLERWRRLGAELSRRRQEHGLREIDEVSLDRRAGIVIVIVPGNDAQLGGIVQRVAHR